MAYTLSWPVGLDLPRQSLQADRECVGCPYSQKVTVFTTATHFINLWMWVRGQLFFSLNDKEVYWYFGATCTPKGIVYITVYLLLRFLITMATSIIAY